MIQVTLVSNCAPRTPLNYTVNVDDVDKCLQKGRKKELTDFWDGLAVVNWNRFLFQQFI